MIIALALAAALQCPSPFAGGLAPAAANVEVVCFTGFEVGYSKLYDEPLWSAQEETAASVAEGEADKRNGTFYACELPDGTKSIEPEVYAKTGYDLGHQTEAGSRGADKAQTFGTCNMSPQTPDLNRKIWAGIEAAVRKLASTDGDIYVVTGPHIPVGAPRLKGLVAVPDASWKAVYDPKTGAAAYDCTNTATPVCTVESIATLIGRIGFDPFPGVPDKIKVVAAKLPEPTKGGALEQ